MDNNRETNLNNRGEEIEKEIKDVRDITTPAIQLLGVASPEFEQSSGNDDANKSTEDLIEEANTVIRDCYVPNFVRFFLEVTGSEASEEEIFEETIRVFNQAITRHQSSPAGLRGYLRAQIDVFTDAEEIKKSIIDSFLCKISDIKTLEQNVRGLMRDVWVPKIRNYFISNGVSQDMIESAIERILQEFYETIETLRLHESHLAFYLNTQKEIYGNDVTCAELVAQISRGMSNARLQHTTISKTDEASTCIKLSKKCVIL